MADAEFRRIGVAEVRAAVAKTGLTLKPRVCFDETGRCGCVLAIVLIAETGNAKPHMIPGVMMNRLGLDPDYGWGLVFGFDNGYDPYNDEAVSLARQAGIDDGSAIRWALASEGATA